jgi:hypothetical protein
MGDADDPDAGLAVDLQARLEGFRKFAVWERQHPASIPSDRAFEAATQLYDLLPQASRVRPIDASGVMRLQRLLRVLMPSR